MLFNSNLARLLVKRNVDDSAEDVLQLMSKPGDLQPCKHTRTPPPIDSLLSVETGADPSDLRPSQPATRHNLQTLKPCVLASHAFTRACELGLGFNLGASGDERRGRGLAEGKNAVE